jgi:hypothetical protein
MTRLKHLYGRQGGRWLPKDSGPPAELVSVTCPCGSWLVPEDKVGAACERCGAEAMSDVADELAGLEWAVELVEQRGTGIVWIDGTLWVRPSEAVAALAEPLWRSQRVEDEAERLRRDYAGFRGLEKRIKELEAFVELVGEHSNDSWLAREANALCGGLAEAKP